MPQDKVSINARLKLVPDLESAACGVVFVLVGLFTGWEAVRFVSAQIIDKANLPVKLTCVWLIFVALATASFGLYLVHRGLRPAVHKGEPPADA